MQEIWKDVEGFEDYYMISNKGNVFSKRSNKVLAPGVTGSGYLKVNFSIDDVRYYKMVHRLVAEAFIENPNNYGEVNHKDENKLNNSADNLEWCTRQYNNTYGNLTKNKMWKVRQIIGNETIAIFESIEEASRVTGSSYSHIGMVCRGERKKCGGYIWRYA